MNLHYLNELIRKQPEFARIFSALRGKGEQRAALRLPEQAYGVLTASVSEAVKSPVLFLSAHPEAAKRRYEQIKLWLPDEQNILYFPEVDVLATSGAGDPLIISERLKILSLLSSCSVGERENWRPPVIVACSLSLMSKSVSKKDFSSICFEVKKGDRVRQSDLLEKLQSIGYERDEIIEIPGTFGKRGGIVDVFPAGREIPLRVEFFGDEIDSIREYDPRTQRSTEQISSSSIAPAREMSSTSDANILDYLPQNAVLIVDDLSQVEAEIQRIEGQIAGLRASNDPQMDACEAGPVYFTWPQIADKLANWTRTVELNSWDTSTARDPESINLPIEHAPNFAARFPALMESLQELRGEYNRVVIVSLQADRIRELLHDQGLDVFPLPSLGRLPPEASLTLVQGAVDGGWRIRGQVLLLTDLELFGIVKQRRSAKARPVRHHWFLNDITIGDLVVHVEHGIGRFAGVTRKTSSGVEREYLVLEYSGGDTLYVPVEQVDRVSLYIGGGERTPALSRLGSQEWNRARQKVKESVENIAGELIELYAGREAGVGLSFSPDTMWQKELEASFPYMETTDQLEALKEVKSDMESNKPMDRLVCGDVGYGKTEIAVRAAFKAVMDGKQVAILVPTTILAQQHINTFRERLKAFPVRVDVLSRFCSQKEQVEVIRKLSEGTVDICIGTHRLLQKDVVFKDLGLAIIDEEQRFGVGHKEHFKKMRNTVDVLTLSATPIPRTMHMALSGIRDLSTIETPPENRLPVITHVGEFNGRLVREAILREMERDGQVFVVHNRVQSIGSVAVKITNLVPEAKISTAHGQMEEGKLEKVMGDFMEGGSNVLVTTTIIESGLDMPNVNTLIVDDSERLGLTQLYQLRGRVGRGANVAYAYFLFDSGKRLTDHARERLKTISHATELGAGFAIAMKDLEIRGAGNLLGLEQSGNIATVGFNYYCQMLAEAVEEIRANRDGHPVQKKAIEPAVSIDLKIPAFIPEHYIEDTRTRFSIYQRLAKLSDQGSLNGIRTEMVDRFGEFPEEVTNLLFIVELRYLAAHSRVESVFTNNNQITVSLGDGDLAGRQLARIPTGKGLHLGNRQIRIDLDSPKVDWRVLLRQVLDQMSSVGASG
jgi:transcription-repair coupling factor (superfamily II helicase)